MAFAMWFFMVLISPFRLRRTTKIRSQDSWCPGQDMEVTLDTRQCSGQLHSLTNFILPRKEFRVPFG
jgi:hypothetical protein